MPELSQVEILEVLPKPSELRETLAQRLREVKLLRQILRVSERVDAEMRARQETTRNA